jgi:hypothetical protein
MTHVAPMAYVDALGIFDAQVASGRHHLLRTRRQPELADKTAAQRVDRPAFVARPRPGALADERAVVLGRRLHPCRIDGTAGIQDVRERPLGGERGNEAAVTLLPASVARPRSGAACAAPWPIRRSRRLDSAVAVAE